MSIILLDNRQCFSCKMFFLFLLQVDGLESEVQRAKEEANTQRNLCRKLQSQAAVAAASETLNKVNHLKCASVALFLVRRAKIFSLLPLYQSGYFFFCLFVYQIIS